MAAYPPGPYGTRRGSTIASYGFNGYVNATVDATRMQSLSLADFYNPHGRDATYSAPSPGQDDRLFPRGSQYGEGRPKPTVLAIAVAAMWCGPCNMEAQCELPELHAKYAPCGGQFLLQLADGPKPGITATPRNLLAWATRYNENFPTAIDPSQSLSAILEDGVFPGNMIIDTTTMKIAEVVEGVPDESYWRTFERLLDDRSCPSRQPIPPKDRSCP
jgi:hypothetical protein